MIIFYFDSMWYWLYFACIGIKKVLFCEEYPKYYLKKTDTEY